jgi:ABC-type polysaccharide/polyol phosphate transport system ATPase subunit
LDRFTEPLLGRAHPLRTDVWALQDISFEVEPSETLGIVGPNGAGKSTLLRILSGVTRPTSGTLETNGRISGILELGTGFHPEFSGWSNIYLNCALQGLSRNEIEAVLPEILDFSGLTAVIHRPLKTFSTGMVLRLAFSIATAVNPDILVVDEALAVGDAAFRDQCLDRMNNYKRRGKTIILVSHDLATVRHFCSEVLLLREGRIVARGYPEEILDTYLEMVHGERKKTKDLARDRQGVRWGSGEIRIEACRLLCGNQETNQMTTGCSCEFHLGFEVLKPVEGVVFGVGIYRSDGTYVHGSNHFWHPQEIRLRFPETGEHGRVICRFPRLPLLPGGYSLAAFCYNNFDGFPQAVDHWERAMQFTIQEDLGHQHGLIALETEWDFVEEPSSSSTEAERPLPGTP